MSIFRRIFYKTNKFYDDDFDWENYTKDSYHRRISNDIETQHIAIAKLGDLSFDANTGAVRSSSGTLHENHQLILEAIGRLSPTSVHEAGCGGGDHVANAQMLYPNINVTGGDRGFTQLELATQRHPQLAGKIGLQDITMPFSNQWPRADLVYTQAVIMHIHTAVSHLVALSNLVEQANEYVLLMENQQCHNFVADLTALHTGGHLKWPDLHIYQFESSIGARATLLSRQALELKNLKSDAQLRKGVKVSQRRLKRANEDSARGIFGFLTNLKT